MGCRLSISCLEKFYGALENARSEFNDILHSLAFQSGNLIAVGIGPYAKCMLTFA